MTLLSIFVPVIVVMLTVALAATASIIVSRSQWISGIKLFRLAQLSAWVLWMAMGAAPVGFWLSGSSFIIYGGLIFTWLVFGIGVFALFYYLLDREADNEIDKEAEEEVEVPKDHWQTELDPELDDPFLDDIIAQAEQTSKALAQTAMFANIVNAAMLEAEIIE